MNKELSALIKLLDDPDEEVFELVSDKITSFGSEVIPILENYWEQTAKTDLQERIELLIHKMQFESLKEEMLEWMNSEEPELLFGAYLVAKYTFPELDYNLLLGEIDKIRKNIWLELNSYLTPLEKINVINNIIFKFHKYNGVEINPQKKGEYLVNRLIETKKGNSFSLVILYTVLCQLLEVPVYALKFPKQLILCYLDPHTDYANTEENNFFKIKFFIDPIFGNIISHNDIELFFKRISVPPTLSFFRPLTNTGTIQHILIEYIKCYDTTEQIRQIKELETLIKILDP
jgi:hypothetical protein